jgi:hypothetical protein
MLTAGHLNSQKNKNYNFCKKKRSIGTLFFVKFNMNLIKKALRFQESFSLVLSQTTDNHLIITTQHLNY